MRAFTIPTVFTAIDKFSGPVNKMTDSMDKMERKVRSVGNGALNIAKKSALVGAAIVAPMAALANEAINFEDRMADVAKTTGLTGKPLEDLSNKLLNLAPSTRTSIEELQKIAGIGGQFGVAGNELFAFTEKVNQFNVALGGDFAGGVEEASKSISVLKNLFKETRSLNIADAITKSGSAINAISAKGVNVPELTDFVSRLGQLPDAIKPSIQATTALGAVLNKAGISSEIGARGVGDILLTASQNLPAFAKQIGMTNAAAKQLINTAPEKFLAQFASSLEGLDAEKLANKLKALKIGDTGSVKVVGALSTATARLAEFQLISNDAFAKGNSLINEYNVKNNTTAAMVAKTKNSFEAFSIILGREILPIVNDLAMKLIPLIKGFSLWAQRNKGTLGTIIKVAAAIATLSFAISAISMVVFAVTKGILAYNFVLGLMTAANIISSGAIWTNTVAMNGFVFAMKIGQLWTKAVTAATWLWNAALTANPIGLVIVGVLALGAALAYVESQYRSITELHNKSLARERAAGFKTEADQIKIATAAYVKYGKSQTEAQRLAIRDSKAFVNKERSQIENKMATTTDAGQARVLAQRLANIQGKEKAIDAANPQKVQQDALVQTMQTNNAAVDININDPNNRTSAKTSAPFVNIKTTSTMGAQN
jgi:tubulin-specific chaperone A